MTIDSKGGVIHTASSTSRHKHTVHLHVARGYLLVAGWQM
jgi:hypothetical protein